MIRRAQHPRLVLHEHRRVAALHEAPEVHEEPVHVPGVEPARGLVEDERDAGEAGAKDAGEARPLQLARGQGRAPARELEVPEPQGLHGRRPLAQLGQQRGEQRPLAAVEVQPLERPEEAIQGLVQELRQRRAAERDPASHGPEARALARGAGRRRQGLRPARRALLLRAPAGLALGEGEQALPHGLELVGLLPLARLALGRQVPADGHGALRVPALEGEATVGRVQVLEGAIPVHLRARGPERGEELSVGLAEVPAHPGPVHGAGGERRGGVGDQPVRVTALHGPQPLARGAGAEAPVRAEVPRAQVHRRPVEGPGPGEQEPEQGPELALGGDGGAPPRPGAVLAQRDHRAEPLGAVELRPGHALHVAADLEGEALGEAVPGLGREGVEGQGALAAPRDAADRGDRAAGHVHVHGAQVVGAHAAEPDGPRRVRRRAGGERPGAGLLELPLARVDRHLPRRPVDHVHPPVRRRPEPAVVADGQHRVPRVDQPAEARHEPLHVRGVEAPVRLVERHQGRRAPRLVEQRGELHPLRLPPAEAVGGEAQGHVAEAEVVHGGAELVQGRVVGEELPRLRHRQRQHVGHGPAPEPDRQRLRPVARAAARVARELEVLEEVEAHALDAEALAGGAAPLLGVEREVAGPEPRGPRLVGGREPAAHEVHEPGPGGGRAAGRAADGPRVHRADPLAVRALERLEGARRLAQERRQEGAEDEGGLAGPRGPGDHLQGAQVHGEVRAAQVVEGGTHEAQLAGRGARRVGPRRVGPREGLPERVPRHGLAPDDPPAGGAGAGADLHHVVRAPHHVRVVLHHHERVAAVAQLLEHGGHPGLAARVEAEGGLVEGDQEPAQGRRQLGGELDALGLAGGEGGALAAERQVPELEELHPLEAAAQLGDDRRDDLVRAQAVEGGAELAGG